MKIVLGTCSTNSDFNGGCEFGLVELTPVYAELILKRMRALAELAKSDQSLHEAHYWDSSASYFQTTLDDELDEDLEPAYDTYVVLDENMQVPENAFKRVEYTHMAISVMGDELEVSWRASPKNASLYVETNRPVGSLPAHAGRHFYARQVRNVGSLIVCQILDDFLAVAAVDRCTVVGKLNNPSAIGDDPTFNRACVPGPLTPPGDSNRFSSVLDFLGTLCDDDRR